MSKPLFRLWEAGKSLLVVLLSLSALFLAGQVFLGVASPAGLLGVAPTSSPSAPEPPGGVGVARPVRMAVNNANGRYGVQYDDEAADALFDALGGLLGEALGSARDPVPTDRRAWEAALQRRGVVPTVQAAFERFLATGKPAYASRKLPPPEEAIAAIHSMGGAAIWAHPFTKGNHSVRQIHQMAVTLKAMGLDGMEAHYALHTPKQVENALEITREVGLLPSGGSDFHGATFRNVRLGVGTGNLQVPDRFLEPLRLCAERRALIAHSLQQHKDAG